MAQDGELGSLIRELEEHAEAGERISIDLIRQIAGQRASGPMLLLPTLLVISPLSIIPGLPSLVGLNTILVAGQIVLGRNTIWLPKWLTKRQLAARHAQKVLKFLKPISRVADKMIKRRATYLTAWPMRRAGALVCVLVGMVMPILEFVPFTSTWAGVVIAGYALAITVRDGLLALAWVGVVTACISIVLGLLL